LTPPRSLFESAAFCKICGSRRTNPQLKSPRSCAGCPNCLPIHQGVSSERGTRLPSHANGVTLQFGQDFGQRLHALTERTVGGEAALRALVGQASCLLFVERHGACPTKMFGEGDLATGTTSFLDHAAGTLLRWDGNIIGSSFNVFCDDSGYGLGCRRVPVMISWL